MNIQRFLPVNLLLCGMLTLCISHVSAAGREIMSLYSQLDSLIDIQNEIVEHKKQHIAVIRATLNDPHLTDAERYTINDRLYEEYLAFRYDSAQKYIDHNIQLAQRMSDKRRYNMARLKLVHIVSVAGLFSEAEDILRSISPDQLQGEDLIEYYNEYNELYLFKSEFSQGTQYYNEYIEKAMAYRKLILDNAPHDSYRYIFTRASYVCQMKKYDEAIGLLQDYLKKVKSGDRRYSILTSTLAFFYDCKKDTVSHRTYLIKSAMSDLQGAIRENNSMRELSSLLFDEGDVERAYRYLNVSIEDASFYGTRLRNTQASQLIPQIVSTYQSEQDAQRHRILMQLMTLSIVALLLIGGIVTIAILMKRYLSANTKARLANEELNLVIKKLEQANAQMKEGNKIKEEYIARFLDLSSTYIDKAEEQRKKENRLARDHKLPELYAELKSSRFTTENTRLFYQNFDSAFLNIYPSFVDEVNLLLLPEGQIILKEGERLTTELRILALIRLGICDNQKIASILRSSITTIYTYRSKLKNRATDKDNFEGDVKAINA